MPESSKRGGVWQCSWGPGGGVKSGIGMADKWEYDRASRGLRMRGAAVLVVLRAPARAVVRLGLAGDGGVVGVRDGFHCAAHADRSRERGRGAVHDDDGGAAGGALD